MKNNLNYIIYIFSSLFIVSLLLTCKSEDDCVFKENKSKISIDFQDSLMSQTPMKYYVFGKFVELSIYQQDIKPLENDSILLFSHEGIPYYLRQTPYKMIFTNTTDFTCDSGTYLIIVKNEDISLSNKVDKRYVENIINSAILEGNKIICLEATSNKTVIEKCRVDENNYFYYYYKIEVFYKVRSINVSIEIYDKVNNIDFEKIYLMKKSIKIVNPMI